MQLQEESLKKTQAWRDSTPVTLTLGTRGFFRVRREFSVLAEGRHIIGCRPKPRENFSRGSL